MALSLRTKERLLEVWLKDGRNEKVRANVSNKLRQILNLDPESVTLYYKEHMKSIKDQSTMKNAEGFKFMKKPQQPSGVGQAQGRTYQAHQHQNAPWAGLHAGGQDPHGGCGDAGQSFRKKSNNFTHSGGVHQHAGDKPFAHLAASHSQIGGGHEAGNKYYRSKAPSHV
jgi:hypothetical protein